MSNETAMPKLSDTMEEGKILRWLKHPGDKIAPGEAIAEVETDKADMVLEAFEAGVLDQIKLNEGESAPVGAVIAMLKSSGAKQSKSAAEDMTSNMENPAAVAEEGNSATPKPIDIKSRAAGKKDAPSAPAAKPIEQKRRSIAPAAVVTDGSASDLQLHPAMAANLSAAPTAMAAPPPHTDPAVPTHRSDDDEGGDGHKLRASPLARRAAEEAGIDISHVRGSGPDGRVTKRDIDNFLREQQLFKVLRLVSPRER